MFRRTQRSWGMRQGFRSSLFYTGLTFNIRLWHRVYLMVCGVTLLCSALSYTSVHYCMVQWLIRVYVMFSSLTTARLPLKEKRFEVFKSLEWSRTWIINLNEHTSCFHLIYPNHFGTRKTSLILPLRKCRKKLKIKKKNKEKKKANR